MSEFEELFGENFIIIDSNNLNSIETKFSGFTFINNQITFGDSPIDESDLKGYCSYLFFNVNEDFISISQDFNGSHGLYLYKNGDYFAISNSFFKLVEYLLENDYDLTLNEEYARAFLFADLCSYAFCETLVNEITFLPRNFRVIIDKEKNKINFEEIDYGEKTVDIDSQEAFEILDSWYFKWVECIRSIKSKTNNISFDLSGGFDTRIVATLWLTANIDLDKVRIKSHNNDLHVHREDFQIASQIADEFDFKLNKPSFSYFGIPFKEFLTSLDISFYTKLGFHKQMYFKVFRYSGPVYSITGEGGGTISGFPNISYNDYLKQVTGYCYSQDSLIESTCSVVERAWSKFTEDSNMDSKKISNIHFMEVRNRLHNGKASLESFFSNFVVLTPIIDPDLCKFNFDNVSCDDRLLLLALIYNRYCPKLLDFQFQGGREISADTIDFARKLNEKYPFNPKQYDFISGPPLGAVENTEYSVILRQYLEDKLKKIFYSNSFENEFEKIFSEFSYNKISELLEKETYYPLRNVFSAIAIVFINDLINKKKRNIDELINYYLSNESKSDELISKENLFKLLRNNTARIDFKCYGKNSDIKIIENSDIYSEVKDYDWFKKKEGEGFIIESYSGEINLEIECINVDKLKIWFRTINRKDKVGNKFPIYVIYENITINDEVILNENKLITHDEPLIINKDNIGSEKIRIHVKWKPFDGDVIFNNKLKQDYSKLNAKYKNTKKKNKKFESQLQEVFNSNSWKLTSIFRKSASVFRKK